MEAKIRRVITAATIWPYQWPQLTKSEVEQLDQAIPNLPPSSEPHIWQTEAGCPVISSWWGNAGDIWKYSRYWHYLCHSANPKMYVDYQIFRFRQAEQKTGEIVAQFATKLRKLAATCDFTVLDKERKSAIIHVKKNWHWMKSSISWCVTTYILALSCIYPAEDRAKFPTKCRKWVGNV